MRLTAGRKVERYIIEEPIGEGAMAVVYSARHETLGTSHAIKVLVKATPKVTKRLLAEGRAQARLRHPNIVSVTDVIIIEGQPGLVMEYVHGPTLQTLISEGRLPVNRVNQLARGILEGASYAHAHSILHRDLKPGNIMLSLTPQGPQAKILDFGLVKFMSASIGGSMFTQSVTGSLVGTPYYMAPEQFEMSGELTSGADVWSLGVLLYELVAGERPFHGKDILDVMQKIRSGDAISLRERCPELPESYALAIEGALRVDVNERWHDAGEMLAAWCGDISERGAKPSPVTPIEDAWTAELRERYATAAPSTPLGYDAQQETIDPGADWHQNLDTSEVPKQIPQTKQTPLAPTPERNALKWGAGVALVLLLTGALLYLNTSPDQGSERPQPEARPATDLPPTALAPATVSVRGVEAHLVRFKGNNGVFPADKPVPAGIYEVLLRNESGEEHVANEGYAVVAGQDYSLACKPRTWVCR